ncbi:MAG: ATP-binding protein [Bacteroidales bacterium]|nr:ATP-binding protein [Bacteroidales bacterium]
MRQTFVIASDKAEIATVEERLFHFCELCNAGNYFSAVSVATLNAVENAIVHGNRGESDKKVTVSVGECTGGMFVEVADQGSGFDYKTYGDLPIDAAAHGVGIFIMERLADKVEFFDGGSRVRLEFVFSGIDETVAESRAALVGDARTAPVS